MERAAHAPAYTWEDFIRLPEDDRRELVDGALLQVEMPTKWHEHIVATITYFLKAWAMTRGMVVLGSAYKVRIADDRGVMPDVQVLTEKIYRRAGEAGLADAAPEIVVEVLSPGSRAHDRVRKLQWYASIGVSEYWIVDAADRSLERLVLRRGTYEVRERAEGDAVFRAKERRGLTIPLAELWKALDQRAPRRRTGAVSKAHRPRRR